MKRLYWWCRIVLLAMRWIPRFNLGDKVFHAGREWMLIQGVGAPRWDLYDGKDRKNYVHESEFRKVRTLYNYWGSFRSGYRFYMGYWFDIWIHKGIKPWMRGLDIWAKRRAEI